MNFLFISPNYPESFWMFCRGLKRQGARVLAVVDQPYDSLKPELRANIDECFVVKSFHDYQEVLRAAGYFTWKYGKIDWIESNNEAWLTLDARLRDDFHVTTGFSLEQITEFQSKAAMKQYYERAGVPVSRYCLPKTLEEAGPLYRKSASLSCSSLTMVWAHPSPTKSQTMPSWYPASSRQGTCT